MKNHLHLEKRLMAMVLVLAMVLSLPLPSLATTAFGDSSRVVQATSVKGESLLEHVLFGSEKDQLKAVEAYAPNDLVTVIVELEQKPLLEHYILSKTTLSVGEYEASAAGQTLVSNMLSSQQKVIDKLAQAQITDGDSVVCQYTTVLNGFAIRVPYGKLATVCNLTGVKTAFIATVHQQIETMMDSASSMTGVNNMWSDYGYTGAGTTIAVIDSGLDTAHEAFQTAPSERKMSKADIRTLLKQYDFAAEAIKKSLSADDVYVNQKVPFAFDYADRDANVCPPAADPSITAHGTHVAGIAAGYKANSAGEIVFSGVAPDAQLLIMKVFPDNGDGATDDVILCALEDAILLDADVINLSLGTNNGTTKSRDEAVNSAYKRVQDAGIGLICAAGNAYDSALYNNTGMHMNLPSDVDTGIVSSPSTFVPALSVASVDNALAPMRAFVAGPEKRYITFTTTDLDMNLLVPDGQASVDLPFVMVGGAGTAEDYAAAGDLTGKIALVQRGDLSFVDKINNGAAAGAAAVIIYNNVDEDLLNMPPDGTVVPAAFITKADGAYLASLADKKLSVYRDMFRLENPYGGQPSEFSSLGVTPDLKLKPEISAPGGYIYSTMPGTSAYGTMSGTSMASPHMAAALALVRQYVQEHYTGLTNLQIQERALYLLMSTAVPVVNRADGELFTPRKQGAGLVDIIAAIQSPAYLSIPVDSDGSTRPRLNLGDDPEKVGTYTFTFRVTNISTEAQTYQLDVVAQAPRITADANGRLYMGNGSVVLDASLEAAQTVTVPAGSTVTVTQTITLSQDDRAYYEDYFENGAYMEGFIRLISTGDEPSLTLPFLGFYGDWNDAPVIDRADWYEKDQDYTIFPNTATADVVQYGNTYAYYLGSNLLANDEETATTYNPDRFVISPNGDGFFDSVSGMILGQLRHASTVEYRITDQDGNLVYTFSSVDNPKTTLNMGYMQIIPAGMYRNYAAPAFTGTDLEGNPLPDGSRYTVSVTANLGYEGRVSDPAENTFSFPVTIDRTAPQLEGMAVRIVERDGRRYLQGIASDNVAVMHVTAVGCMSFGGSSVYPDFESRVDVDVDGKRANFELDITDIPYDMVYLFLDDYGYNESLYSIPVNMEPGITMASESMLINEGQTMQMSVLNNSNADDVAVVWSSSNEDVATVDENGLVTGIKHGVTLIRATASNGEYATCMLGVRETQYVTDMKLSAHEIYLPVRSAGQLRIETILPQGIIRDETDATWVSSDPSVVELLEAPRQHYFAARKEGTAVITATLDGISDSCTVHVVPRYDENGLYMYLGYPNGSGTMAEYPTIQSDGWVPEMAHSFYVAYKDDNDVDHTPADAVYTWTTSDPSIIKISCGEDGTVNSDGSITANNITANYISCGTATITATDENGRSRSFTLYIPPNKPSQVALFNGKTGEELVGGVLVIDPAEVAILDPFVYFNPTASREEDRVVAWKSFDESIVSVTEDEEGNAILTGLKPGYTMITGTLVSGSDNHVGVYVLANKATLKQLVDSCSQLILDAFEDGAAKDAYIKALEEAKKLLKDLAASQEAVDAAAEALKDAKDALKLKDIDEKVLFQSASTFLDGTIGLNYYVTIPEDVLRAPDARMVFMIGGAVTEIPVSRAVESEKDGQIRYRFTIRLAAAQMADQIVAQMFVGETPVSVSKTYSIQAYATYLIGHSKDAKEVALMKAMLNYGAAAQLHFGRNTDNLANQNMEASDRVLPNVTASMLDAYAPVITGQAEGIRAKSGALLLQSGTTIRVYFELTGDKKIEDFHFQVDGVPVTPVYRDGRYFVDVPGIAAAELNVMHTITCDGITVSYSPLSYVRTMLSSDQQDVLDMIKGLYGYHEAAKAFFGK